MRGARTPARLFALLVAGVLGSGSIATSLAGDPAFQQMLPLYNVPPANNQVAAKRIRTEQEDRFGRLQSGAYGKPEDFTAKARLAFKTDMRPMVAESRSFVLKTPTEGSLANGWRSEGRVFSRRGESESRHAHLVMPLTLEQAGEPFRLGAFDELWIDYTAVPGVPLCMPQLELQVLHQPLQEVGYLPLKQ